MPESQNPRDTLKTAASSTTKPKSDRKRDRHRPGYIQPKQRGAKMIGAQTKLKMHKAFKRAAEAEHKTMTQMISEFIEAKATPYMTIEGQKELFEQEPSRAHTKSDPKQTPSP